MDSPAESPICHAERVIFADKPNLPRSLRLSSDKQDKQEQSFSKHTLFYEKPSVVRSYLKSNGCCSSPALLIQMSSSFTLRPAYTNKANDYITPEYFIKQSIFITYTKEYMK